MMDDVNELIGTHDVIEGPPGRKNVRRDLNDKGKAIDDAFSKTIFNCYLIIVGGAVAAGFQICEEGNEWYSKW